MISEFAAFCSYTCGLAFFAIAALAYAGRWQCSRTMAISLAVMQGIIAGIDAAALSGVSSANMEWLRLLLEAGSLAALFELGLREFSLAHLHQARWAAAAVVLAALAAWAMGMQAQFEIGYCLVLAALGALLAVRVALRTTAGQERMPLVLLTAAAAVLYLLANCLNMHLGRAAAMLLVVAGLWLHYRDLQSDLQHGSLVRRWRWPAGYVLLLAVGWFLLVSLSTDSFAEMPADVAASEQLEELLELEVEAEPSTFSHFAAGMEKAGIALLPILAVIALVIVLSRMPFAH